MTITFVFPQYYAFPIGAYRAFFEYANRLSERDHQVTLVMPGRSRRLWMLHHLRSVNLFPWFDLSSKVRVRYVLDSRPWTIPPTDVLVLIGWRTASFYPSLRVRAERTIQFAWDYA